MIQNNVTRLLKAKKIPFEIFVIPDGKRSAQETAEILNVPIGWVYKTIVLRPAPPGKVILAVIPANKTADLKLIAKFLNEKKLEFPSPNEAEKITGLQTGGISALALLNKGFRILIDKSVEELDWLHVSGGQRGLNIKLRVQDFLDLTHAKIGIFSKQSDQTEN